MLRTIGFCLAPIGGLVILKYFANLLGLLSNFVSFSEQSIQTFPFLTLLYLICGIALFAVGIRLLKGEIGVVFICLGCLAFMISLLGIFEEFFGFSMFSTPHSIGKFIGHSILLPLAIVLVYLGISSFSKKGDSSIIDS